MDSQMNSQWLPIESAPRDGSEILVWSGYRCVAKWFKPSGKAGWWTANTLPIEPTLWAPLPDIPAAPSESVQPATLTDEREAIDLNDVIHNPRDYTVDGKPVSRARLAVQADNGYGVYIHQHDYNLQVKRIAKNAPTGNKGE